jgi:hypothetical protein
MPWTDRFRARPQLCGDFDAGGGEDDDADGDDDDDAEGRWVQMERS